MASHEYQITIFSPDGKLNQIEYAFKAIKSSNMTSLGLKSDNCVVVCTEKKIGDALIDPTTVTNIYRITPQIGVLVTGREADGRAWIQRLRKEAFDYLSKNGIQIQCDVLAQRAADIAQLYTQKSFMRAYAVELMFFSYDNEKGALLYKVDPAGLYMGYQGVSSGVKEQEAQNILEKEFRENNGFKNMTRDQVIKTAIKVLQNTIGQDFKKTDIELGVIDSDRRVYQKLNIEEIEEYLKSIQNED